MTVVEEKPRDRKFVDMSRHQRRQASVWEALSIFFQRSDIPSNVEEMQVGEFMTTVISEGADHETLDLVLACLAAVYLPRSVLVAIHRATLEGAPKDFQMQLIQIITYSKERDIARQMYARLGGENLYDMAWTPERYMELEDGIEYLMQSPEMYNLRNRYAYEHGRAVPGRIKLSVFFDVREQMRAMRQDYDTAYSGLRFRDIVDIRGRWEVFMTPVALFLLAANFFSVVFGYPIRFISLAMADEQIPTSHAYVPPLGIAPDMWKIMIAVCFAWLIVALTVFFYKGYLAKEKSETAADVVKAFIVLIVGLFFGRLASGAT